MTAHQLSLNHPTNFETFLKSLQDVTSRVVQASGVSRVWILFKLIFLIHVLNWASTAALREVRAVARACQSDGADGNFTIRTNEVSLILECLSLIAPIMSKMPMSWAYLGAFRKMSEQWEALAEELYIRSDPEVFEEYLTDISTAENDEDREDIRALHAGRVSAVKEGTFSIDEVKKELGL